MQTFTDFIIEARITKGSRKQMSTASQKGFGKVAGAGAKTSSESDDDTKKITGEVHPIAESEKKNVHNTLKAAGYRSGAPEFVNHPDHGDLTEHTYTHANGHSIKVHYK